MLLSSTSYAQFFPRHFPSLNSSSSQLNYFQQGRSHILLVSNVRLPSPFDEDTAVLTLVSLLQTPGEAGGAIGVVSLEDVIEEMIGEEVRLSSQSLRNSLTDSNALQIVDETDLYIVRLLALPLPILSLALQMLTTTPFSRTFTPRPRSSVLPRLASLLRVGSSLRSSPVRSTFPISPLPSSPS